MVLGLLALVAAAIFTGAAFYVNVAEQPARLSLDDRALLTEWKSAYKRGAAMQAPLALIGFLFGMLAWWQAAHPGFLIGTKLELDLLRGDCDDLTSFARPECPSHRTKVPPGADEHVGTNRIIHDPARSVAAHFVHSLSEAARSP